MVGIAGVVVSVVDDDPDQYQVMAPAPMPFVSTSLQLNLALADSREMGGPAGAALASLRRPSFDSVLVGQGKSPSKSRRQTVASGRVLDGRVGRDRVVGAVLGLVGGPSSGRVRPV